MANIMARIVSGNVVNTEWHPDNTPETDTLKNLHDRPVGIGDTYSDGKFYRDGVEILTPLESVQADKAELEAAFQYLMTGGAT